MPFKHLLGAVRLYYLLNAASFFLHLGVLGQTRLLVEQLDGLLELGVLLQVCQFGKPDGYGPQLLDPLLGDFLEDLDLLLLDLVLVFDLNLLVEGFDVLLDDLQLVLLRF